MYFVYILYSENIDKYYVGFTAGSVENRLLKHLADHKGFTGKAKDWQIKRVERYSTKEAAMSREKIIKKWKSRKLIENLVGSTE